MVKNLGKKKKLVIQPLNKEKKLQNIFTPDEKKNIFQNVETIQDLNKKFMNDLKVRLQNWSDQQVIGDVFNNTVRSLSFPSPSTLLFAFADRLLDPLFQAL
jgi:FKBP-type peptidyl-prolyl cis-trans isomerase (trigger factor)